MTRTAIIQAAARLFARQGYAATTIAAIAEESGVTPKSVYALADKPGLLLLAVEHTEAQARAHEHSEAPEPEDRQTAGEPEDTAGALLRRYPIQRAFEQAAAAEPVLREAWRRHERRRRADLKRLVRAAADAGRLRPGLTVGRATDTLWALVTWHAVALLVEQRGWSRAKLTEWLDQLLETVLVGAVQQAGAEPPEVDQP
jgi:AcrR family transcriptional regulator